MWFQSLFCWICLLDNIITCKTKLVTQVSILVLLDLPFGHSFPKYFTKSLFCFNPCFVGSAFWTFARLAGRLCSALFQSLFCWICLLDFSHRLHHFHNQQVSILVLLDLPFGLVNDKYYMRLCLVSILVLLDLPFGPDKPRLIHSNCIMVSILVLLDLPFGLSNKLML